MLKAVHGFLWGLPALVLILSVGLGISICAGWPQFRLLKRALGKFLRPEPIEAGRSARQAVYTALAATVGTGNLVGVAGAICLGGPGAVFWMWICGFIGMATKYAEVVLAQRFRVEEDGICLGGPMHFILRGLGQRWMPLAAVYALCGVIAAFGVGNMVQINAVMAGIRGILAGFGADAGRSQTVGIGLLLAVAVGAVLLGGARRIGQTAERMIPALSAGYIFLCLTALVRCRENIPDALAGILRGAWDPGAVTGGAVGSAFLALRTGCARGVFTNEAGMGTAAIAHAGARVSHPVEQGLFGIVEVFVDTVLICTLTALVILSSGAAIPYGRDTGGELTLAAFQAACGGWSIPVIGLCLGAFAFATVLGWSLYGGRCAQFLWGKKAWVPFALAQTAVVAVSGIADTGAVWLFAETANGLMALPNLLALAALLPEVCRLTAEDAGFRGE